eukprot:8941293-Pyramimonas_sp.AAC.1
MAMRCQQDWTRCDTRNPKPAVRFTHPFAEGVDELRLEDVLGRHVRAVLHHFAVAGVLAPPH